MSLRLSCLQSELHKETLSCKTETKKGRKEGLFRLRSQFHVLVCTLYSGDSTLSDMII